MKFYVPTIVVNAIHKSLSIFYEIHGIKKQLTLAYTPQQMDFQKGKIAYLEHDLKRVKVEQCNEEFIA